MKTYLTLLFQSQSANPSEIISTLQNLGFEQIHGQYDMVYDWGNKATIEKTLWFADKIHEALKGTHVYFRMESEPN